MDYRYIFIDKWISIAFYRNKISLKIYLYKNIGITYLFDKNLSIKIDLYYNPTQRTHAYPRIYT